MVCKYNTLHWDIIFQTRLSSISAFQHKYRSSSKCFNKNNFLFAYFLPINGYNYMSVCNIFRILLILPSGKYCLCIFVRTAWNFLWEILEIALKLLTIILTLTWDNIYSMKCLFLFDKNVKICYILDRYPSKLF